MLARKLLAPQTSVGCESCRLLGHELGWPCPTGKERRWERRATLAIDSARYNGECESNWRAERRVV